MRVTCSLETETPAMTMAKKAKKVNISEKPSIFERVEPATDSSSTPLLMLYQPIATASS